MRPQTRIRKMRQPGRKRGRSTDGVREIGYDQDILRAKAFARAMQDQAGADAEDEEEEAP